MTAQDRRGLPAEAPSTSPDLDIRYPGIPDIDEAAWDADSLAPDDVSAALRELRDRGPRERIAACFEEHYIEVWFSLPPAELKTVLDAAPDVHPQTHPVFTYIRSLLRGESVPLLGDAYEGGLKASDPVVHTTLLAMAVLEARLHGELRTAIELSDQIALKVPGNALLDGSRGNASFMFTQAGITRMLAGDFAAALGAFERVKWTSPPSALRFFVRDAHAKAALIHALVGDPDLARRELAEAESIARTASWAEPLVDTTVRLAQVALDGAHRPEVLAELAALPRQSIGEMWPFFVMALTPAVCAGAPGATELLDALESSNLPGASKGEGLTGSVFALVRAAHAAHAGHISAARTALAAADHEMVLVCLANAGLALDSGSPARACALAVQTGEGTVGLRQLELWRLSVLLLVHRAKGEDAAAAAARDHALRLADKLGTVTTTVVGHAVRTQIDALLRGEEAVMTESVALVLTPRELEVLEHLAAGISRREIAEKLFVSENTVKTQVSSLYRKLDASSRAELLALAHTRGLI